MPEPGQIHWIATPDGLAALCEQLDNSEWIALDTEFMRESSYFPKLCLIQLATPERVACVDPLALTSLDPLLNLLNKPQITKVLHAARQDLEIFFNLTGQVPAPIFDTQVAASLIGLPEQIGYGTLVAQLLGVQLEKSHTRDDWSRRPLPQGAVEYAADDVRYLRDVYLKLHAELQQRGRLDWLERERQTLENPATYRPDPAQAWQRLRGTARLKPAALAAAKALAAWREQQAISHDRPRQWILKDEFLYELARQKPETLDALSNIRGLPEASVRKYGEHWLTLLRQAQPDAKPAAPPARLEPAAEALLDTMMALVRLRGAESGVGTAQLATRAALERLLRGERNLDVLSGWRLETVGRDLLHLLDGSLQLSVRDGRLVALKP